MSGNVDIITLGESWFELEEHIQAYTRLLAELGRPAPTRAYLEQIQDSSTEIVAFALMDGEVVGTAHASFANVWKDAKVHIENVVVAEGVRRRRVGVTLMDALHQRAIAKWGHLLAGRSLIAQLTNRPQKENAGFYRYLKYSPRTVETGDPTVVWVKGLIFSA